MTDNGKGKGKGKGTPPGTPPTSGRGMPSWPTMPPQNWGPQGPQNFEIPKVTSAVMNGRELKDMMNQLIESNGYKDPTKGMPMATVLGEVGALTVKTANGE